MNQPTPEPDEDSIRPTHPMPPPSEFTPRRLALIGCGGAGKSTVARQLGSILGLPVHHLDALFWKSGWVPTEPEEWARLQDALCRGDSWVIDGNYGRTLDIRLAAADAVLFFDFPRTVCLWRVVKRTLRHLGRTRADMAAGCVERINRDYFVFLRWIWNYRRDRRPGILEKLAPLRASKVVIRFGSDAEVANYLRQIQTTTNAGRPLPGRRHA